MCVGVHVCMCERWKIEDVFKEVVCVCVVWCGVCGMCVEMGDQYVRIEVNVR